MSNEVVIPNNSTFDVVTFDILSDGQLIDPRYQIMYVAINKEINRIPSGYIIIRDGEASEANFAVSSGKDFVPGKKIEIKAGRDGGNATVFKGIIVKHGIKVRENGNTILSIVCKDESVKLSAGRKNRYYTDSKDSEILEEILGSYNLQGEIEATSLQHKEVVQHYATDWDFICCRAEMNGKMVIADDGKVSIKAPNTTQNPTLTLTYGTTILDFEAEMDAVSQWKSVTAQSWDYSKQEMFEAETTSIPFTENGNISGETLSSVLDLQKFELKHSGQVLPEELQSWSDACMLKSRLNKIIGRAKFIGFADIKPGLLVELQGVGERFNGKAYVSAIRQELVDGNWFTHAQFGFGEDWFCRKEKVIEVPASGLLPGVRGLQIGKVVQLQDDPDGEHRILVKLPIVDHQAQGLWARVGSLDAGENRGAFFRPEIDDEVIVGFINDDPRDAIVLGMLNSSAKPAPITATDDNHEKGFVTRSDMRLLFEDDKKIITLKTPAGNSIVISEEESAITLTDQNNNTITMDAAGIALNSPKDIKIEATGSVTIKATGELSMEGMNVSAKANAQFQAEGQAGAKLSSSAIAEIQGSLVKIN